MPFGGKKVRHSDTPRRCREAAAKKNRIGIERHCSAAPPGACGLTSPRKGDTTLVCAVVDRSVAERSLIRVTHEPSTHRVSRGHGMGIARGCRGGAGNDGWAFLQWSVGDLGGGANIGAGDRLHHKVTITQPGRSPQVVFDAPDSDPGPGERSIELPDILQGAGIEVEVMVPPPVGQQGPPQLVTGKTTAA